MKIYSNWKANFNFVVPVVLISLSFFTFSHIGLLRPNDAKAEDSDVTLAPETNQILTRIEAKNIIIPKIEEIWTKIDQKRGLRALQYEELLPAGTQVKPASLTGGENSGVLTCDNDCWLFFVDEAPGAHFEHPVRIVVIDANTGVQKVLTASMWPVIYPPGNEKKTLFGTFLERKNPDSIILEKHAILGPNSEILPDLQVSPPGGQFLPFEVDDTCDSWAIIVCGYNDLPDTFDEDTNGIYAVLKGLGIADDHIFYISPHTSHSGVDRPTTYPNVQWAINEVATRSGPRDKVLFFYSSHGGIDSLSCVPDISPPDQRSISASNLDTWLDAITSAELTVIIEACHSGSLIGMYADGTYVAAEDDLTGDGEINRVIFTSASTDTSSYPDRDDAGDPNPSDLGSETIWGYVEAFSISGADTNTDGAISFSEAFQYAWDNDVTRILGWNTPQMVHTGLNTADLFHHCYPICDSNGPYVLDCEDALSGITLDGSASDDPAPCEAFAYDWTTDCPGASFDDPSSSTPLLSDLTPENGCLECNVSLTTSCNDGNWEACSSPVIISDTSTPSITCPNDIEIECHESKTPANTGNAAAADNCDPSPEIEHDDHLTPGGCPGDYTITRTWSATDGCGNLDSCSQMIRVSDQTSPALSGVPASTTVECDSVPAVDTVSAVDNCDSNPMIFFSETRTDGSCPNNYTLTRTWTATDSCGNSTDESQVITVQDTTSPVISCNSPATITPPDAPISFTATATDNCDMTPSITITAYDCYKLIKKDKRIDKTESCIVEMAGDRFTILDTGGVDDHIAWTVVSTDSCGNVSTENCEVLVVNPAKQ